MTEDLETPVPALNIEGQIKSVFYNKTFNLGNYENEKIGIVVEIKEGQTYDQVLEAAKAAVHKDHADHDDIKAKISAARRDLWNTQRQQQNTAAEVARLTEQKADLEAAIKELSEAHPEAVELMNKPPETSYKVGDWVKHSRYGLGKIDQVDTADPANMYWVDFEDGHSDWFPEVLLPAEPPADEHTAPVSEDQYPGEVEEE